MHEPASRELNQRQKKDVKCRCLLFLSPMPEGQFGKKHLPGVSTNYNSTRPIINGKSYGLGCMKAMAKGLASFSPASRKNGKS